MTTDPGTELKWAGTDDRVFAQVRPDLPAKSRPDRLPGLDGMRAVAVLGVILTHFLSRKTSNSFLDAVARQGGYGVNVFFVISGFIITFLLLREDGRGGISLALFYARRALRILPPIAGYLMFLSIMNVCGVIAIPKGDFAASLFFIRNYIGTSGETGHFWTLAIEEQFYLIWPVLIVLLRFNHFRLAACVCLLFIAPIWRHWRVLSVDDPGNLASSIDLNYSGLLMGATLAVLINVKGVSQVVTARWFCNGVVALFAVASLCFILWGDILNRKFFRAFAPEMGVFMVAIVLNCAISGNIRLLTLILDNPVAVWIGRLSFSLYIWQQFFIPPIPNSATGFNGYWYQIFPANIGLTVLLASASYYLIELPCLSIKKKFGRVR